MREGLREKGVGSNDMSGYGMGRNSMRKNGTRRNGMGWLWMVGKEWSERNGMR
jgi:hypothetical protein